MLRFLFYFLIKIYQIFISPFFPKACRFDVSCSNNFLVCLNKHGGVLGFYFGCRQIALCGPWFDNYKGGCDGRH